jgi:hypothetical protein
MSLRRKLFWAWCGLTLICWVSGAIHDGSGIVLKFQIGGQGRWIHLALGIVVAIAVPVVVLLAGRAVFWAADQLLAKTTDTSYQSKSCRQVQQTCLGTN